MSVRYPSGRLAFPLPLQQITLAIRPPVQQFRRMWRAPGLLSRMAAAVSCCQAPPQITPAPPHCPVLVLLLSATYVCNGLHPCSSLVVLVGLSLKGFEGQKCTLLHSVCCSLNAWIPADFPQSRRFLQWNQKRGSELFVFHWSHGTSLTLVVVKSSS